MHDTYRDRQRSGTILERSVEDGERFGGGGVTSFEFRICGTLVVMETWTSEQRAFRKGLLQK